MSFRLRKYKNFALMNLSYEKHLIITITDNVNISWSNSNQQLLYNKIDVKENSSGSYWVKSETRKIKKRFNINDYKFLVNDNKRNIFSDKFREKRSILITFVNNISLWKDLDDIKIFFFKYILIQEQNQYLDILSK